MKIAVLTMVFNNNYGGYLQCYALMQVLKQLGHQPELLQVSVDDDRLYGKLKRFIKNDIFSLFVREWRLGTIEKNTKYFEKNYIVPKTKKICNYSDFKKYSTDYDAYVVGSDQVWRPTMYPFIDEAFFSFVRSENPLLISYAASFGVDRWEFTVEQTERFKKDLARFKAVSVREDSAVNLCRDYWEIEAKHVLDPTMLLSAEQYKNLVEKEIEPEPKGEILTYILDATEDKKSLIEYICKFYDKKSFMVNRDTSSNNFSTYPTVTSWLKGFMQSKFVITDSFHGCVFAIIFNKPFIVYGNKRRGQSRFDSLLKIFGLEDRLIQCKDELNDSRLRADINWTLVNQKLIACRRNSYSYLEENLRCQSIN